MSDWLNTETDESTTGFSPLPAGKYQVLIEKLEVRQTKAKTEGRAATGELIAATFSVLTDGFAGRKVFENYNIVNDNEKASKIGRGQFAEMAKAAGVTLKLTEPLDLNGQKITDFDSRKTYFETLLASQLNERVFSLNLAVEFDDYKQREVNRIKSYDTKVANGGAGSHGGEKIPF